MSISKVSVVLPLLLPDDFTVAMTKFCMAAMRANTRLDYELVVVETATRHFDASAGGPIEPALRIDKYLHRPDRSNYVLDWNAGADAASGDYLVHMGNDVIVGKNWLEALLKPFGLYRDCGVTCTAAAEPGACIGPRLPAPIIVEGMFAPMMMFRKEWRLDTAYEGGYSDSDLIMRLYDSGLRAYRNCESQCFHFDRVTWDRAYDDRGESQIQRGQNLFYQRWGSSPLMMYAMIRAGGVIYGREHESALASVPSRPR